MLSLHLNQWPTRLPLLSVLLAKTDGPLHLTDSDSQFSASLHHLGIDRLTQSLKLHYANTVRLKLHMLK